MSPESVSFCTWHVYNNLTKQYFDINFRTKCVQCKGWSVKIYPSIPIQIMCSVSCLNFWFMTTLKNYILKIWHQKKKCQPDCETKVNIRIKFFFNRNKRFFSQRLNLCKDEWKNKLTRNIILLKLAAERFLCVSPRYFS